MSDVLIVGGGVIGLTCAWELSLRGAQVTVLEQSELAKEASWAGAGMIPPGDLGHLPTHQLAVMSSQLWPELTAELRETTGVDNEYRACQGLLIEEESHSQDLLRRWTERGVRVEQLSASEIRERVPQISESVQSASLLVDQCQVRNPRHLRALIAGCQARGVRLLEDHQVIEWKTESKTEANRISQVMTHHGQYSAKEVVVTAGAWSRTLLESLSVSLQIKPIRGQIVLLNGNLPGFQVTIESGSHYLVPRVDGRLLIGATEEDVAFERANTPEAIQRLRAFARQLIPATASLQIEKTWCGFRPHSQRGYPYLGRVSGWENLTLAAGHFRAGLSNSPATARLIAQLLTNEPTSLDLSDFSV